MASFGFKNNYCKEQIYPAEYGYHQFGSIAAGEFSTHVISLSAYPDLGRVLTVRAVQELQPSQTYTPDIVVTAYIDLTADTANIVCINNSASAVSGIVVNYAIQ